MKKTLEVMKACRAKWLTSLGNLSNEELNKIPTGFSNNLAWQLGHVVVSQQLLCYKLSGNSFVIDENLIDLYKNGSKPERKFSDQEIEQMKGYLIGTVDQLVVDLANGMFNNFTPYKVSTYPGFTLENIEDAIKFIVSHDALHYGCSLIMKKLVVA
jgi:hypothetical protein